MKKLKLGFFIGFLLMASPYLCKGQNNTLGDRDVREPAVETQHRAVRKHHISLKQRLLFRKPNVKHTAQYEFYVRIEKAAKEKQRMLRKLARPQYSDFTYFGHKNKPKKHLPYAMRYCKECGIRH